ncbi:hypothetical protein [Nostoc sp.]
MNLFIASTSTQIQRRNSLSLSIRVIPQEGQNFYCDWMHERHPDKEVWEV